MLKMFDDDDLYYLSYQDSDDSEPYYDDDDYFFDDDDDDDDEDDDNEEDDEDDFIAKKKSKDSHRDETEAPVFQQTKSLVDICCKYLAVNFPFSYLQDRYPPIPDDLQLKVISSSFPDNEDQLKRYAEFSERHPDFHYASKLCEKGSVTDLVQIGKTLYNSIYSI